MGEDKPRQNAWKWREYFNDKVLEQGAKDEKLGKLEAFHLDEERNYAAGKTTGGFKVAVGNMPKSYLECEDYMPWNAGQNSWQYGTMRSTREDHYCSCSQGQLGHLCRHLASLMIHLEKVRGPYQFTETEEERKHVLRMEEEKRRKEEEERRRRMLEQKKRMLQEQSVEVSDYLQGILPELPPDVTFHPEVMVSGAMTDRYETSIYESISGKPELDVSIQYDPVGEQVMDIRSKVANCEVFMRLGKKSLLVLNCSCGRSHGGLNYYWSSWRTTTFLCGHALAACASAYDYIVRENPGDETDRLADQLLTSLAGNAMEAAPVPEERFEPKPIVSLIPKITVSPKSEELQLSFSAGLVGGHSYLIRRLNHFCEAVEGGLVYEFSKKTSLDFSIMTFTEESAGWFRMLRAYDRGIQFLSNKMSRDYYYSPRFDSGSGIPLMGNELDEVYDLAEGGRILYQKPGTKREQWVDVKPGKLRVEITLTQVRGKGKRLVAIDMEGVIPRTLKGARYQYILDDHQLCRISAEEMERVEPFTKIAGNSDTFRCRIGHRKFAELYYRVLPELRDAGFIELHDEVGQLKDGVLPLEPEFTFFLDRQDGQILCTAYVAYGEERLRISGYPSAGDGNVRNRDVDQEQRVEAVVRKYFPEDSEALQAASVVENDETLISILTEGIAALERFGEVKGSDSFHAVRISPAPKARFQVSLDSGLLDLSIQTKDLSPEELLELLESYRKKKRWHRLKSGDFVDLRDSGDLRNLEEVAEGLDVDIESLVRGEIRLPEYRSLYLDSLLEAHEELAASRDRHFKSLVRSFHTIKDSDYDVPAELADVLRPYQQYGFRWLSTLAQTGFGGILADEMGLGKTVQMLAFLQAALDAGETKPSLVVCPASLVYNWGEEARRFAPRMAVVTLAGTAAQRKEALDRAAREGTDALFVTSYDLLKRDVKLFENITFSTVVLDEAQYIKNQKALVTKAVKVLKAVHRFALTGTPIENRLSELWSIFDYLMPGFLYTGQEFTAKFEQPIMKGGDSAATQKLSKMTEPFILRRKKGEVLKDLPEKMEETKSFAIEGEQRQLYDAQVVHMKSMLNSYAGSGEDKIRILAEITRLRQICCDPSLVFDHYHGPSAKREACLDLIERAIDGGHRMLVFSQFTSMMALLEEDLKKKAIPFYVITGATPKQERLRLVNDFNSGTTPVFLISLKAGGTGLNLTGADVVIHYDPWWNLAVQNQATDRAHRIGQTRQVTVIRMIAADSIEEKIAALQEKKRELADAIIGNQENSLMSMSKEDLLELLS